MTNTITIKIEVDMCGEYKVFPPDNREVATYYTDDKNDAMNTAYCEYGCVKIKFKTVDEHTEGV